MISCRQKTGIGRVRLSHVPNTSAVCRHGDGGTLGPAASGFPHKEVGLGRWGVRERKKTHSTRIASW